MASNGFQISYANERPPSSTGSGEVDIASDPASSSFFTNDYKKHEDLKSMLDSNKDNLKLEAMKRIIGMVAKGKDASDLFPAVVKNVVSKNIEVKKLVYVYLVRYAEEQQDLALLSISTFQRALKDPNQLIRASALRVLSSIRVPMIAPIMMLAIKEAVMDMSPYVRKTAAHAIPKLHSLDPEQKESLVEVIEKLLADKTTLVAGSAIQAFEEVCPERIDLIHKNYRKLCNLLVDVEEWGQVVIINMLTRYSRTQFVNPNQDEGTGEDNPENFYESDEDSEKEKDEAVKKKPYVMDPDHRLLLRTCKPLLNSRNAGVVMAVAQLYHHCAPKTEVGLVAKALVRLLRGHKEVQFIVLSNIASISVKRKGYARRKHSEDEYVSIPISSYRGMFEPYLKSFYVHSNDPTQVKLLKLEILTNLATETNISTILREFQTYVTSSDKEFAAATIQAIGRCASSIAEITDACLNGLVSLLSNRDEAVVGESVVVIKKLLQMQPTEHKDIIMHMAKLADTITVPMARASILWLIGEYSDRVPKIAPDVLRKMAKVFINEEDIVKLQILNLAAKLCITNSKQTKLLCQYVFNLAKYDQNYDIRDRARFLRQLILPGEKGGALAKHAKKIFLATKPAPVLESKYKDRDAFQLGTLSHIINSKAVGYQELPEWPEAAPDPGVRNVEVAMPWADDKKPSHKKPEKKRKSFYSSSESSDDSSETSGADTAEETTSEEEESDSGSGSNTGSDSEKSKSESESEKDTPPPHPPKKQPAPKMQKLIVKESSEEEESESEESSSEESEEESETESDSESEEEVIVVKKSKVKEKAKKKESAAKKPATRPTDMLLDLDFGPVVDTTASLSAGGILTPSLGGPTPDRKPQPDYNSMVNPAFMKSKTYELLNRITGGGLQAAYRFTRTVSIFSPQMVSMELVLTNMSDKPMEDIRMGEKKLQAGMAMHEFPAVPTLAPSNSVTVVVGIDFNDTTQSAQFELIRDNKKFNVSISAPVGELVQPNTLTENDFLSLRSKLTGMNENSGTVVLPSENNVAKTLCNRVYETANILQVPSMTDNMYLFASKTCNSRMDVLITIKVTENKATVTVNSEKMVIGSMLVKDLKVALLRV